MSWPALVFWGLIVWGFFSRSPALIYILNISAVFASLQMLPGTGSHGVTVLPQSVAAIAFVGKTMTQKGNLRRALATALDIEQLGLMTGFVVLSLLTALMLPRMFAGWVEVVPLSSVGKSLLVPSAGNLTQSGYLLVSYGTMISGAVIGANPETHRHYFRSLVWTGVALVVTGVLDLASFRIGGLNGMLDAFRTANYSLLLDGEINGAKRVVGVCSEASVFGSLSVNILAAIALLRTSFTTGPRRIAANVVVLALVVMVALSTSSSSYLGLTTFIGVYGLLLARDAFGSRGVQPINEVAALVALVAAASVWVLLQPDVLTPAYDMIDRVILQKTASSSYLERNMWTATGWDAFLDTAGLGTGFGSVRTSNWFVSVLGSTGVLGGVLVFGQIAYLCLFRTRKKTPRVGRLALGYRLTLPPFLIMAALGGTIPDFGVEIAVLLGLLAALAKSRSNFFAGTLEASPAQRDFAQATWRPQLL